MEAELERDYLGLTKSDALLNEEVFLVQLNRRATLLNEEFQNTILHIVSSHALPEQNLQKSDLEFELDVDTEHQLSEFTIKQTELLHKSQSSAKFSHVVLNVTEGITKDSDDQGTGSFQKYESEDQTSLIADAVFCAVNVPDQRKTQKNGDSVMTDEAVSTFVDNNKNDVVFQKGGGSGHAQLLSGSSDFQIHRGDSGSSYQLSRFTSRLGRTFFSPFQQSQSTAGHETFKSAESSAGLTRSSSARSSSQSSHALQIRCQFRDCSGMVSVCSAPVKNLSRMREKIREYSREIQSEHWSSWPLTSNILDPVRASIVCEGPSQILEVFRWFSNESSDACNDESVKMRVCRIKNKFSFPKEELVGGSVSFLNKL